MKQDNFHVGLNISVEVKNSYERIPAALVGWDYENFIIAKGGQFRDMQLSSQDCCVVRFVKDGVAYGFQTHVLNMGYYPTPLVFMKYPHAVDSMPFRKSKRVNTNIPAKVMDKHGIGDASGNEAHILDLSETGCFIEAFADWFRTEDSFYLTFMILDKSIEADCIVKNIRKTDKKYFIGAEFNGISSVQKEILHSFIGMFTSEEHYN